VEGSYIGKHCCFIWMWILIISGVVIIYPCGLVGYLDCKSTDYFRFQGISGAVLLLLYIPFTIYIPCYSAGASETVVLNMSTLAWSVVTSVQGRVPIASEVLYLCILTKLHVMWNLTRVLILVNSMLCCHKVMFLVPFDSRSLKCFPLQGLSLVVSSYDGEDVLVSFGGYNGRYNNEVKIIFALFLLLFAFVLSFFLICFGLLHSGLCS